MQLVPGGPGDLCLELDEHCPSSAAQLPGLASVFRCSLIQRKDRGVRDLPNQECTCSSWNMAPDDTSSTTTTNDGCSAKSGELNNDQDANE